MNAAFAGVRKRSHIQLGTFSTGTNMIWITRDGRIVCLSQMGINHLRACIKKIQNSRCGWRLGALPYLLQELDLREMG